MQCGSKMCSPQRENLVILSNSDEVITKMSLHDLLHVRDLLCKYSNINTNI